MDLPTPTTNGAGAADLTTRSAPGGDGIVAGPSTAAVADLAVSAGRSLTFDPEGVTRYVSPDAAVVLGVTPADLTGRWLDEVEDPPAVALRALDGLRAEVQRTGNTLRCVVTGVDGTDYGCVLAPDRPDGVVCTIDDSPAPVAGAVDVASPLFDHAPIGMGLASTDGAWLEVNQALCALTGQDRSALSAMTVQDVTVPEDRFADFVYHRQVLAGELTGYQLEQRWQRADGGQVWVLVAVSATGPAGAPDRLLVQVQDITARKEAEARAGLLAELVDCSVDAIWARDGGGEVVFWNRAAAQLLGYVAEDLVGSAAGADLPESRIAETAHVLAIAAGGRSVGPVETIRRHKDGHDVDVSLTVSPIVDAEGGLLGFASVARALEGESASLSRADRAEPGRSARTAAGS